jgi:hypothetical protein
MSQMQVLPLASPAASIRPSGLKSIFVTGLLLR